MKTALAVLTMVAMVATGGCSKTDEPEAPEDYGNAPTAAQVPCSALVYQRSGHDENLTADQTKITGGRTVVAAVTPAAGGPAAASPTTGGGDSAADIAAVKAQLAVAMKALKAKDIGKFCDALFDSDVGNMMKKAVVVQEKGAALEKLVRTKFGLSVSNLMKGAGGGMSSSGALDVSEFEQWSIDQFKFSWQDGKVTVVGPDGEPAVFVRTAQGWKMEVPAQMKPVLGLFTEMAEAQEKVHDALTSEINAGKVTKETLPERVKQLAEQYMKPVAAKLLGAMMGGMTGPPGPPSSAPGVPSTGF